LWLFETLSSFPQGVVGSVRGRKESEVRLYDLLFFLIEEFKFVYGLNEGCLVLQLSGGLPPFAQARKNKHTKVGKECYVI
jgi:hypothetical protein